MIRHIYTAKFKPGVTDEQVDEWWAALQRLDIPGMRNFTGGRDLHLREGNADFGLTADFDDAEGWRRYDEDDEHNRIRRELAAPITAEMGRAQFEAPEHANAAPIRNIALFWRKEGVSDQDLDQISAALNEMHIEGMSYFHAGRDLGFKEGNADAAVVADLQGEEAYRAYDTDAEHNRIRQQLVAPAVERLVRVQFGVSN